MVRVVALLSRLVSGCPLTAKHLPNTVYIIHDSLTAKELEYVDQLATENARRFKDSFTQVRAPNSPLAHR